MDPHAPNRPVRRPPRSRRPKPVEPPVPSPAEREVPVDPPPVLAPDRVPFREVPRVEPRVPPEPDTREPAPLRDRRRGWTGPVAHQGFRGDGSVRDLSQFRGSRLTGTRDEARRQRSLDRRSRSERVDAVMWTLGVYRAVSRRAVVASCFDGHSFAANPVLSKLVSDGLVGSERVAVGRHGYQVFGLTSAGADWLRSRMDDQSPDTAKKKKKAFSLVGLGRGSARLAGSAPGAAAASRSPGLRGRVAGRGAGACRGRVHQACSSRFRDSRLARVC